jgi:hypothetical protein
MRSSLTISIAFKPNVLAATTICDRVYRSSCRDGVRMMEVSAQSTIHDLNIVSMKRNEGEYLQSSEANLGRLAVEHDNECRCRGIYTRRALNVPPSSGPCSDFQAAMSPRFQTLLALSILATMWSGDSAGLRKDSD